MTDNPDRNSRAVFDELRALATEQRNPRSMDLDRMSVRQILETMNREDHLIPDIVAEAIPQIEAAVDLMVPSLQAGGRIVYVGAGTSGRLGVLDAAECPPTFGTEPWQVQGFIAGGRDALVKTAEGAEDNEAQGARDLEILGLGHDDVVIGITASRRTPYVIGALNFARAHQCKTVFVICNEPPESVPADVVISVPVGPELLTGSTRLKAGTATKLVLNMLTTTSMVRLGKCYENLMVNLKALSQKLKARARRILMDLTGCDYEWADTLLKEADGELKTALVMHWKGIGAEHARDLLDTHRGNIRKALEG